MQSAVALESAAKYSADSTDEKRQKSPCPGAASIMRCAFALLLTMATANVLGTTASEREHLLHSGIDTATIGYA